jgi:lipoprotein-releasing system ATP-binding protein
MSNPKRLFIMSDEIIVLENLSKRYINKTEQIEVLADINLSVRERDTISIQGISGVGKTTLLNLIGGFDSPSSGRIIFQNEDITHYDETDMAKFRCKNIGYVFQSFYLLEELNLLENIILPALKLGLSRKDAVAKAMEISEILSLTNRLKHFPSEISGGEKQRAAIARAVINSPKLICADEPTGNLDIKHKNIIAQLLFKIVESNNLSLILVTHEVDLAARCKRKYKIEDCHLIDLNS